MANRFHACATCIHFRTEKLSSGMNYHCSRLGYPTQPHYRFQCWKPKENVQRLLEKEDKLKG
ncbi:hypothetical protein HHO41_19440 [Bacillus sp. DNRA2]|uniref:hypothetical protein n=1 Tax=Bacillus sp. DNRA2 TaxID=2723053 RepID=UPI00145EF85E|nr:hypothetical protein [Bacillus sp. DNRA2]NMD72448.1 hypothetical protein [Bacillus sp. DNRA2]